MDLELAGVRIHGWLDGVTEDGLFGWRLNRLGEWELAPFWLRHLLLNIAAPPASPGRAACCRRPGTGRPAPGQRPAIAGALAGGLPRGPLHPAAADHQGQPRLRPRPAQARPQGALEAARSKARLAWEGLDFGPRGESQDPWYALAFRDRDPLDARFETLAETLLGPALDALADDGEEDA